MTFLPFQTMATSLNRSLVFQKLLNFLRLWLPTTLCPLHFNYSFHSKKGVREMDVNPYNHVSRSPTSRLQSLWNKGSHIPWSLKGKPWSHVTGDSPCKTCLVTLTYSKGVKSNQDRRSREQLNKPWKQYSHRVSGTVFELWTTEQSG